MATHSTSRAREKISSVSRTEMEDLEMALLSGRGYTGNISDTSRDSGCTLTELRDQEMVVWGEEGPDSQVKLTNSPTL